MQYNKIAFRKAILVNKFRPVEMKDNEALYKNFCFMNFISYLNNCINNIVLHQLEKIAKKNILTQKFILNLGTKVVEKKFVSKLVQQNIITYLV